MSGISKQTGWSNTDNLLYEILKELKRLNGTMGKLHTTTTTTTHP
jgi:hypothetical protein